MFNLESIKNIRWGYALPMGVGLLVAGGLGGWVSRLVQKPQVVFVRTNDVMARYKLAMAARETFKKETAAWGEEVNQLEERLRETVKEAKLTDPKVREQVSQMRSRMEALREKGAQRDQELMAPVVAEVNAGIKKFAQKHGYSLVLGTLQGGVILHGEEGVDVTDALVAELNR